jgi:cysteine desulfurase/selenocysteine lyase
MSSPDVAVGTAPPGLPDLATLNRLAGEFFSALPGGHSAGGVPVPANPLPAGLTLPPGATGPSTPSAVPLGALPPGANLAPTSLQSPANAGASAPALRPHAVTPTGVPDLVIEAAPGYDSRLGGPALGVPQAAGASPAPAVGQVPYYFLAERGQHPASAPAELPRNDRVDAESFGLPGADALRALLAGTPRSASPPTAAVPASAFYFVEPAAQAAPAPTPSSAHPPFDVHAVRRDFPILRERVNGRPLVWFDNAATTQKPAAVIARLKTFYEHENSNIHRAAHELAARATDAYEGARETVRRFIGAGAVEEIVFVRGTTEAINLVAKSWGVQNVGEGDEIIVSHLEHHANIVPWQQLAAEKGAKIRVAPVDSHGQIILEEYEKLFNPRTRVAAFTQVSNALGTITPAREMVEIAHRHGALALVDGAQTVSHQRVDVQALDADFYVFSGHKVFGPTGIGALYGKTAVLEHMPPWQGGGNMIADVTFEKTVYQPPPFRFEAGTGNIADAVGLGAAIDYVMALGLENIARYEHELLLYATEGLCQVPGLTLIGTAPDKAGVLSFVLDGMRTEDVGAALDKEGIAVRSGHHCAQPILRRFGLEATVRASLAPYNTTADIDALVAAVSRLQTGRPRL